MEFGISGCVRVFCVSSVHKPWANAHGIHNIFLLLSLLLIFFVSELVWGGTEKFVAGLDWCCSFIDVVERGEPFGSPFGFLRWRGRQAETL